MSKEFQEFPEAAGKVVVGAFRDLTSFGYDIFRIDFTDGTYIEVEEQGQAGFFSVSVKVMENK